MSGEQCREALRRTARQRPAQRAVPGVEIQIAVTRFSDQRYIARRRRPQARPAFDGSPIASPWKKRKRAGQYGIAALRVYALIVTRELGGARDAEPRTQP